MIRIYKIEKFIPKVGSPVFQIHEELEANGQAVFLDPRNPTAEELQNADDQFAAAQQATIAELTAEREQLKKHLDAANAKIVEFQSDLPWDVRIIDASAFLNRISQPELLDLLGSDDPVRKQIGGMLLAYKQNDWPIMLDSPEMQQAIGYLVQSGAISEQRASELLRDSTREESYRAGD